MNIEDALLWVDRNCYDEATVQRLRSRKVARTLADEIKRLRVICIAIDAAVLAERARICAAIKTEDDHCAAGDYMLDSDDCIAVAQGVWARPEYADEGADK